MNRKNFIKSCGFACMGGAAMAAVLQGCTATKILGGKITGDDLIVPLSDLETKAGNEKHYKKYVLVFIIPAKVCQSQEINDSLLIANARVYHNLSEALQNKDSVYILDLSKQKFATIPSEVFLLANLRILKLEKCKLQASIPK